MSHFIEFVDGNTGKVVAREPADQVPPINREVYLREGVLVSRADQADEVVPIVRVVKLDLDAEDRPVPKAEAVKSVIQEFDAQGRMRRESIMLRDAR